MSGVTTSNTCYVELTTNAGASFRDNAGVQTNPLTGDASKGATISSAVSTTSMDVRVSNLQIIGTGTRAFYSQDASNKTVVLSNCICMSNPGDAHGVVSIYGTNQSMNNCLVVDTHSHAAHSMAYVGNGAKAYNCTIVAPSNLGTKPNIGINGDYDTPLLTNCSVFGAAAVKSGTPTFTNCVSDISGTTGVIQVTYNNSAFVDTTNNWKPAVGSTALKLGATDNTGTPATDIVGSSRSGTGAGSCFDGCWELVAAATYTGSGGGTVEKATTSATGAYTTPVYTASGSPSCKKATASAAATFTVPVYTGTGSPSATKATASATGTATTPVYTGTGTPSAVKATASASGTYVGLIYTGAGSPSVTKTSASAAATYANVTYTGDGSPTVTPATGSSSGTFVLVVPLETVYPSVITKHGTTTPTTFDLADFQLGFDSAAGKLYIRSGASIILIGPP
jgi:hypothetical protein